MSGDAGTQPQVVDENAPGLGQVSIVFGFDFFFGVRQRVFVLLFQLFQSDFALADAPIVFQCQLLRIQVRLLGTPGFFIQADLGLQHELFRQFQTLAGKHEVRIVVGARGMARRELCEVRLERITFRVDGSLDAVPGKGAIQRAFADLLGIEHRRISDIG